MKKLLAIAVILTGFVATEAFAQSSANATVSLTVNGAVSITATHNTLDMGSVAAGTPATVAVSDGSAALFTINSTNPGSKVSITWNNPSITNGSWTLSPTYSFYGNAANSATTGGTTLSSSGVAENTDGTTGNYYVYVGATVTPASNAGGGTYTGTLTMSVAIN